MFWPKVIDIDAGLGIGDLLAAVSAFSMRIGSKRLRDDLRLKRLDHLDRLPMRIGKRCRVPAGWSWRAS